jgi:hypothetical protein
MRGKHDWRVTTFYFRSTLHDSAAPATRTPKMRNVQQVPKQMWQHTLVCTEAKYVHKAAHSSLAQIAEL